MNELDAKKLGLHDGQHVKVASRYGEVVLPINICDAVMPGELFTTFHTPNVFVNRLTGPYRDKEVGAPEYKVTAVRLEVL